MDIAEFDLFIKLGAPLPEIGKPFEVTDEENRDDLTVYLRKIVKIDWDLRRGGINIVFIAEYKTDKYGLSLAR